MTRLVAIKSIISDKLNDCELNAGERARLDTEYIQRQTRTEVLWKGLRRMMMLRQSEKSGWHLPSTSDTFPFKTQESGFALNIDTYLNEALSGQVILKEPPHFLS